VILPQISTEYVEEYTMKLIVFIINHKNNTID